MNSGRKDRADLAINSANMSGTYLDKADLSDVNLIETDLSGAVLSGAVLRRAVVSGADLRETYLNGIDLHGADLSGTNLRDARGVTDEQLEEQALTLQGATMPGGQKYEDWLKSSRQDGNDGGPS
jgi:uncharacterized protein YjbI with pentapeptide repeats